MDAALTSVKALLRRALRRRAMTSSHTLKSLFKMGSASGPIIFTAEAFETEYLKHRGELICESLTKPDTRDIFESAYISELKLHKELVSPEHEYIVAYVSVRLDDSDTPLFLGAIKAERTVHEGVTAKQHASFVVNDSIRGSVTASSIPLSSPNPTTEALDRVFIYDPRDVTELNNNDHRLLYHYKYKEVGPPLFDFVVSAITLHIYSPDYKLFQHQCFWFAAMLFRMVGGKDAETREPHDKNSGDWKFVAEKTVTAKPGRFMDVFRIVTQKAITEEYAQIEPRFKARLADKDGFLLRVRQEKEEELREVAAEAAKNAKESAAKDAQIAAKDAAIAAKDAQIATRDAQIAALQEQLARVDVQADHPLASSSQLDHPLAHQT